MGAIVSFSRTLTGSRCSGGLTIATLNFDDAPWCGVSSSVAAKLTAHQNMPSRAGAGNSTSVQYSALVPGQGVSRRLPWPMTAPDGSLIRIFLAASPQPAEDLAPT